MLAKKMVCLCKLLALFLLWDDTLGYTLGSGPWSRIREAVSATKQNVFEEATTINPENGGLADTTNLITNQDDHSSSLDSAVPVTTQTELSSSLDSAAVEDDREKLLRTHKQLVRTIKSYLFDVVYAGDTMDRAYARFYALETIARMPYFSYLSVLHLLETLGKFRQANRLALHFAETWNELHHLLTMEELLTKTSENGEIPFKDRFVAQHIAVFYYWFAVGLYLVQPATAYSLNQAVEEEAYETYDKFLTSHGDFLKQQPAPQVAKNYYSGTGQDMFDRMHLSTMMMEPPSSISGTAAASTTTTTPPRRVVKCETLYDCFVAIRDDELEHSQSMDYLKRQGNNLEL